MMTVIVKIAVVLLLNAIAVATEEQISRANANFATNLSKILSEEQTNIFFSPLSLYTILTLLYQGAAGETADAFAKTLFLPSAFSGATGYKDLIQSINSVENVTLDIANKIYAKTGYKLSSAFENIANEHFHSEVEQVNFAESDSAAKTINDWVKEKTHNRIQNMIRPDSLDDQTRLMLVNAIYFKGDWKIHFDEECTWKRPFYLNANDKVYVDMMHIDMDLPCAYNSELDAKITEVLYENEDVSMMIILPEKIDGIEELEEKLSKVDISSLSKDFYETEVALSLPKFKIETELNLKNALEQLGLGILFSEKADLSGLLESSEPLPVSEILQKAFIEVNEEGTEASAVSGGLVMSDLVPPRPSVYVDHPFVFLIKYKNKVLFYGRIKTLP